MSRNALTNSDIAELLALEASASGRPMVSKALRKASRAALLWPVEVVDLLEEDRSLTELNGVGPFISKTLQGWMDKPPKISAREETRKGFLTLTEARSILLTNPKWKARYKGDLQMHTVSSDGSGTLHDMALAGLALGYEYIGVTDHSKGLKIANGIDEARLECQGEQIDELNERFRKEGQKFRILKSIELNLNTSGQGDMDPTSLEKLDVVVGSFHSALRKTEDQTIRYIEALDNPNVHILGHPRGRVYNYRVGLTANWKRIFDHAAKTGTAVEIDSYPDRQDLNVDLLKLARASGCLIAIDTDAHHPPQLEFVELGLAAALKAKLKPENILNFQTADKLLQMIKPS